MLQIRDLIPTNLEEEKEKFFADQSYNPQFLYVREINQEQLYHYGLPKPHLVEKARSILERVFYNKTSTDLIKQEGRFLSQREVHDQFVSFLKDHALEKRVAINWSATAVTRATARIYEICLKSTSSFQEESVKGLIYHEVGTHILRYYNYEQQPWFKKKKKCGFKESHLFTEEGLAVVHSLIPKSNKFLHQSSMRYLATDTAQRSSFVKVWQFLEKFVDDWETRWMIAVKVKRGIKDTSQPGGYAKDIVYFDGALQVLEWLLNHNFSLEDVYMGKCSMNESIFARKLNKNYRTFLPNFYTSNKDNYAQEIATIARANL